MCKPTVDAQWPAASHEASLEFSKEVAIIIVTSYFPGLVRLRNCQAGIPSISLFSGVGGLDLALRRPGVIILVPCVMF